VGTAECHHAQVPPGCRVERVAVVGLARYGTHFVALRVYIGCYFVKWPPAAALKLRFVASPLRALAGLQNPPYAKYLRWVRSHSRRRSPVAVQRPTRRQLAPFWLLWHCGIGQALRAVFWSVACGHSLCVCPAHPCGPRRCAAFGPALGARPPPRGSLIPAQNTSRSVIEQCSRRFAPALLTHNAAYITLMRNRQR